MIMYHFFLSFYCLLTLHSFFFSKKKRYKKEKMHGKIMFPKNRVRCILGVCEHITTGVTSSGHMTRKLYRREFIDTRDTIPEYSR